MRVRIVSVAVVLALLAGFSAGGAQQAVSFVNFESGHVRPLALSPSADYLHAVNTPDNRVEIFLIKEHGLRSVADVVVGLEPVAVAASDDRIYVVNHLSESVSVVNVTRPERPYVEATLWTGDEPRDVVLAGSQRNKLFVTAARRGQNRPGDPELTTPGVGRADVWVWKTDDLEQPPHILTLFCDTPRSLAVVEAGSSELDLERLELLRSRAEAGDGDLVLHGLFGESHRGFVYLGVSQVQTDRRHQQLEWHAILDAVVEGEAVLTATVVPRGSGRRIGIDRDEDGVFDGDELRPGGSPLRGWQSRP